MTPVQIEISFALAECSMLPGGWDKRMMRTLNQMALREPENELTAKQDEWMYRLLYKYRRQIPHTFVKYKEHPHCNHLPHKRSNIIPTMKQAAKEFGIPVQLTIFE